MREEGGNRWRANIYMLSSPSFILFLPSYEYEGRKNMGKGEEEEV